MSQTNPTPSAPKSSGLFRTADGLNLLPTFILVTSLFLLWGFCNGLIGLLNKHFQDALHITKAESGLVESSNYIAYFLMAIPAGLFARRFGYKGGIIVGLSLITAGAFWFIPATHIGTFWAFLTGLFIIASGMTCLETIANPYTTLLGATESSATRINIAQTLNGSGWILSALVGGQIIFGGTEEANNSNASLYIPYLGIGLVVAVLIVIFCFAKVPDLKADEEAVEERKGTGKKPLWKRWHFTFGVLSQFLYVAAQAGIFGFFVNYILENDPHMTKLVASKCLMVAYGLFTAGRLCGSFVVGALPPHRVLAGYAAINTVLMILVIHGGTSGFLALFAAFFFMSIMFPTIFALGIRGLGDHTKLGSSLIVMSIVGGAIAPPLMGHIADTVSMHTAFFVPFGCFIGICIYGTLWQTLEYKDANAPANKATVNFGRH